MAYWLFKSEPETFSIDDLQNRPSQVEPWDGVRNYKARNYLRDEVKINDTVFFYHSNCATPGIVGIAKVVKAGYPDTTAFDKHSKYYDATSSQDKPRWFRVDVKFIKKFKQMVSLQEIKQHPILANMQVANRGNRLSITQVTDNEANILLNLAKE